MNQFEFGEVEEAFEPTVESFLVSTMRFSRVA